MLACVKCLQKLLYRMQVDNHMKQWVERQEKHIAIGLLAVPFTAQETLLRGVWSTLIGLIRQTDRMRAM